MRALSFKALRAICLALPLCAACRSAPPPAQPAPPAVAQPEVAAPRPPPAPETPALPVKPFALPSDWSTLPPEAFEAVLAAATREECVLRLDDAALAELGRALAASDAASVRAAVILGNTRDPRAFDVLVARLEARAPEAL